MNLPARSRLTVLIAGMALLAAAILWSAVTSWRAGRDVRLRFEKMRAESSHTISHLRDGVLDMSGILMTFEVTGDQAVWAKFHNRSEQLSAWLNGEKEARPSESEKAILAKIDDAYAKYRAEAETLAATQSAETSKAALGQRFAQIQDSAQKMLALGTELSAARRQGLGDFVSESETSMGRMQQVIFASLLALLGFAGWSVRVMYRDLISPLQVRLIETREIAERQEKLAALGVLAAGVAHEIRNPLTAIKARLFTQQKALAPGSPAHHDSEFIGKEIDRLARIVSEFLAFARPAEPRFEPLSPAVLLNNVRELLAPQLQAEAVELVVEPGADAAIEGDAQQLQQVLINLVQNSADSIGAKGRITLRVRTDRIALSGNVGNVVILEVEDNGKGIPAEVQERLFDPFFSTKSSGMGLGLSIAARIVEKHGGALQYQTQVNRGTRFGLILPARS